MLEWSLQYKKHLFKTLILLPNVASTRLTAAKK